MEQNFYSLLTDIGKAKIANAAAFGNKINLTKFIVGDGAGGYYEITESQKKLKNKIWEGKINSLKQMKDNPNWLELECIIPADVGGFMIRELGVIDDKENLIVICKYPETYKPLLSNGCAKELRCKIIIEISNATSNVLQIDSTVLLATQDDIKDIKEQFNTNKKNTDEQVNKLSSQCEDLTKNVVKNINDKTGDVKLKYTDLLNASSVILCVDCENGNDNNDGTTQRPFKTFEAAVKQIDNQQKHNVVTEIKFLRDYQEAIVINDLSLKITCEWNNLKERKKICLLSVNNSIINFSGIILNGRGNNSIYFNNSIVHLYTSDIVADTTGYNLFIESSRVSMSGCEVSGNKSKNADVIRNTYGSSLSLETVKIKNGKEGVATNNSITLATKVTFENVDTEHVEISAGKYFE